jgi:hypothetical protein
MASRSTLRKPRGKVKSKIRPKKRGLGSARAATRARTAPELAPTRHSPPDSGPLKAQDPRLGRILAGLGLGLVAYFVERDYSAFLGLSLLGLAFFLVASELGAE